MTRSKFTTKIFDTITHIHYENLYYINGEFFFLSDEKTNIPDIKTLGGPEHSFRIPESSYTLSPTVKIFKSIEDLNSYVNELDIKEVKSPTVYFSHYYDHNIGHGLFDALYPIYLAFLNFEYYYLDTFNILINLLFIPGWKFSGKCSRNWLLDIFQTFSKGQLFIKSEVKYNYKFSNFITGSEYAGISSVNINGVMPGKSMRILEKLRDRFYNVYDIKIHSNISNKPKILFIDSSRYNKDEKEVLIQLNNKLNQDGYNSRYIYWTEYPSFKDQLQIMQDADIHVSASGTSMMNFIFLQDHKFNINLGTHYYHPYKKPSFMEINLILVSNYICSKLYDIHYYKQILYDPLHKLINESLYSIKVNENLTTVVPKYIKIWREYCNNDPNITDLILRMNGKIRPDIVYKRWIDFFIHYPDIFNDTFLKIDFKLLEKIKVSYDINDQQIEKNIFQIYHDKNLIPEYVKTHLLKLNPNYKYHFINFEEGKKIIYKYFDKELAANINLTLDTLPRYCHKSDLLRYCMLYIYGGVYLDCDLKLLQPISTFLNKDVTFFTSFGRGAEQFICTTTKGDKIIDKTMANGIIASTKNNKILLELIHFCIKNPVDDNPINRGAYISSLYNVLTKYCLPNIKPFTFFRYNNEVIYLITQYDTRSHGNNCFIDKDDNVLIDINSPEYSFKRQTSSFLINSE